MAVVALGAVGRTNKGSCKINFGIWTAFRGALERGASRRVRWGTLYARTLHALALIKSLRHWLTVAQSTLILRGLTRSDLGSVSVRTPCSIRAKTLAVSIAGSSSKTRR